ncbi:unnamed protein product [Pleuronectes platessa]|uniref:Uncharacterized protein n=1 Tax=Pleuronectes platessa TaxID=8262 RepID=A0A9N7UI16_PLEPL|nr:unnamed protein product [Pleuronectes platessa]
MPSYRPANGLQGEQRSSEDQCFTVCSTLQGSRGGKCCVRIELPTGRPDNVLKVVQTADTKERQAGQNRDAFNVLFNSDIQAPATPSPAPLCLSPLNSAAAISSDRRIGVLLV